MLRWFRQLDSILRGHATQTSLLQDGQFRSPAAGLAFVILLLGIIHGLCMGSFAMIRTSGQDYPQFIASAIKLPALFFLTLAITFPSLYVFNALLGSRMSMLSSLRLFVAMLGIMLATLASLGPIVVFFAVSTTSYSFMVLLNVLVATVAGVLGLAFLLRALNRLLVSNADADGDEPRPVPRASDFPPPLPSGGPLMAPIQVRRRGNKAWALFRVWVCVFALVGAQMSWVLRPLIGSPNAPFEIFRHREGNFFIAVFAALNNVLK